MHHDQSEKKGEGGAGRWGILVLLMFLCFISHFNRASITSAGDERIMTQYQIASSSMGYVYSGFLVVYTLFMIPGGWFIDRYGPRLALLGMGLGSALFCVFTGGIGLGIIPSGQVYIALLVVRSFMGLMSTPLHPAAARTIGLVFAPRQEALANGLITGASILAYSLAHPVFGWAIDHFDWPVAFMMTGGVTALIAVAWYLYTGPILPGTPTPQALSKGSMSSLADAPQGVIGSRFQASMIPLTFLTLSYAAVGYFQYLFFYWLHYYFQKVLHWEDSQSRFYAGLPSLAMAICMPLGGLLTSRWDAEGGGRGLARLPRWGMMWSGAFLLMGIVSTHWAWIVLWFTASLGMLGLCKSSFWTMAVRIGGPRAGMAAAIMNTGGNALGLVAPVLTPWMGEALGWNWGLGMGVAVIWAGWLCWFWIHPPVGGARSMAASPNPS